MHFYIFENRNFEPIDAFLHSQVCDRYLYKKWFRKNFGTDALNILGLTEDSIDAMRRFCDCWHLLLVISSKFTKLETCTYIRRC